MSACANESCGCDHSGHGHESGPSRFESVSLVVSGTLIAAGLAGRWSGGLPTSAQVACFAGAMVAGGWMLVPSAWAALRRLRPNISLLMVTACIGAAFIGEWAEAATVVFLFGVAEWLEGWADRRSHRAIRALLEVAPDTARVRRDREIVEVPVETVAVGEMVAVRSGQRVPLDGVVVRGTSAVNQAPITGESMPVKKGPGDEVFAGSINGEGSLEVEVTRPSRDSLVARIIRLVEEAQERRTRTERFVDVFARYYTPGVALMAVLVAVVPPLLAGGGWSEWLYRALVLLVIACPCALVIATPVAVVLGLTVLARKGVLVKGGVFLETLGKLNVLAVDKTGTVTMGEPQVLAVEPVGDGSEEAVLQVAAALDLHSTHPVARAMVAAAERRGIENLESVEYRTHPGRGAEGVVGGHRYFVGNHRFAHELGVCSPELEARLAAHEEQGRTAIVVGHAPHDDCTGDVLGIVAVGDAVRENAREAIAALRHAGIRRVVMLSGDNQRTAEAVAKEAGIDEARGDLLPDDKLRAIETLRGDDGAVGMVGDGVNDAPALAAADVGIAMGHGGTDTAIETADVALMKDDLTKLAEAIELGRRTLGIVRFNIGFALGIKALFLVLAVAGYTSLWLAILADTGATLLVILNALRLLRAGRET